MEHSMSEKTIAFLTPYGQDEAVDRYARTVLGKYSGCRVLVLADDQAPLNSSGMRSVRCWTTGGGDFARVADMLRLENVTTLHVNYSCADLRTKSFYAMLAEQRKSGLHVVAHFSDAAFLQEAAENLFDQTDAVMLAEEEEHAGRSLPVAKAKLRVLMQNRANAFSQPGGDTVVMEKIAAGLRELGQNVEIDVSGQRHPGEFDVVHLFNFATPEITEQYARRCHAAGVPYVVTTMYEDWPAFYSQMSAMAQAAIAWTNAGQPRDKWSDLCDAARRTVPVPHLQNSWTAEHACALVATGTYEAEALRRDYPKASGVTTYFCGYDNLPLVTGDRDAFIRETGLSDFVLCVGRLEARKNQLLLLKALEDIDLPLVFVTGGFTYQPEYDAACRKFRRRGKTVFLSRLEPKMLAGAYGAARVHALPSWFELPGLVSMEAAAFGCAVVVSDLGTARDYFGEDAQYCHPGDDASIRNAVLAAYHMPVAPGLCGRIKGYTWQRASERHLELYSSAVSGTRRSAPDLASAMRESVAALKDTAAAACSSVDQISGKIGTLKADGSQRAAELCDEGDKLMKGAQYGAAAEKYQTAISTSPSFPRALRSRAVALLTLGEPDRAQPLFEQALRFDPRDSKSLVGLGAVAAARGNNNEAFGLYLKAAELNPDDMSSLLHLIDAAYRDKRLPELEEALRRFLNLSPQNMEIQYCLAGCYFAQEKYAKASGVVEHILQIQPAHEQAVELRHEIEKRVVASREPAAAAPADPGAMRINRSTPRVSSVAEQLRALEELKRERKYDEVLTQADRLMQQTSNPELALVQILKAEALGCLGRMAEAEELFRRAEVEPGYTFRALCGRGALTASQGNWIEARAFFNRAKLLNPKSDVAYAGLGMAAQASNSSDEAWDLFQQALNLNPENLQALHGLMQLGYSMNRLPQMERALESYLDMNPVDFPMRYSLAGCIFMQGRAAEAAEHCRKILLFQPDNAMALELLQKAEGPQQSVQGA